MGTVVVDASVVIGLRDATDAHHGAARLALQKARSNHHSLVLPVSAYAEVLVRPLAAGVDDDRATGPILALFSIEPLSAAIASRAAHLRARTSLRLPDALVVATGLHLKAERILTCDDRWKGVSRGVQVLSPGRA